MSSHPLAQLTAFGQAHLHAPKVVFVPSVQAGQYLAAALAAGGRTWANLRLVTPAEWAAHWAGPQLAAAGWRRLSADEEFFLVWETLLPELSHRFVQHCMGAGGCRFTWDVAVVPPPAPSVGACFAALAKLQLPAPPEQNGLPLRIWDVAGAEAEIRVVLRDVLQESIPLDQVELVYTTGQPYLGLVHSLAEQLGVEVDAVQGFPPYLSSIGQALIGFYRWVGSGFDPAEMGELCRAGPVAGALSPAGAGTGL